ncbi:ATP-dependent nuclease [Paenibacillus jilunlii]|uniref:ATP-dependent endonuclease n=1 Tax=Paenibacillus jilunlii TaxID=682956 RepID=A0A1G9TJB8_9BACL|nr:AAA family ATPase [Paenibacillus jilunlii]KWX71973.1 ATP-dependent endonuclease [Paenibacillus jilunlii]SDM47760.1 putative ATP-dependent endonuclease of the OLD family [Paenibacillus jilunlii]
MAKKKAQAEAGEDLSAWFEQSRPKLRKMIIRNFRCIGSKPVFIDLDDIVVLVGPNNVGKSSILKAYEMVMNHGSKKCLLTDSDFPNGCVHTIDLPQIELHTIVNGDSSPALRWVEKIEGQAIVRERWTWHSVNTEPKRQGYDVQKQAWDEQVPWGAPGVAQSKRPQPHMVEAFAHPQDLEKQVLDLLNAIIKDRIKNVQSLPDTEDELSDYARLLRQITVLRKKILDDSMSEIQTIESDLSSAISEIFPGYVVKFDPRAEDDIENDLSLFKSSSKLLMGPGQGYQGAIDKQGSGARRTLLWSALRLIVQNGAGKKTDTGRPHVLLLDEPELCLHPNAVREACRVLYDLPRQGNWQVMLTTHSPAFIDLSRNNTTIVRVERSVQGDIFGTTVFRPEKAQLDDDDRERLKLLNLFDPHVAEFFFGGHTIIVEGDTEYTAFKYIISKAPERYRNIHIVRARGKATIISLCKILNHFGNGYSVLHDTDFPILENGNKNPAWAHNASILAVVNESPMQNVRHLSSMPNFEAAYFGQEKINGGKPYNAFMRLQEDPRVFQLIEKLLSTVLNEEIELPYGCIRWGSLEELLEVVTPLQQAGAGRKE